MIVVTQLCGATTAYFVFGVCASALAAADFSVFVLFGFESTFPAAFAALAPVWRVLRPAIVKLPTHRVPWQDGAGEGMLRVVTPEQRRPHRCRPRHRPPPASGGFCHSKQGRLALA